MKLTKKITALLCLAAISVSVFAGCSEDEAPTSSAADANNADFVTADSSEAGDSANTSDSDTLEVEALEDYSKYNSYSTLSDIIYEVDNYFYVYDAIVIPGETFEISPDFIIDDYLNLIGDLGVTSSDYLVESAVEYIGEEPSYNTVDGTVKPAADAILAVMDVMYELQTFENEMLFADEFDTAKAQELHTKLNSLYDNYYNTTLAFTDSFDVLAEATALKAMEQQLANNELIVYHSNMALEIFLDFDEIVWATVDENGTVYPDAATVRPLAEEVVSHLESLLVALKDPDQISKVYNLSEGTFAQFGSQMLTPEAVQLVVTSSYQDYLDAMNAFIADLDAGVDTTDSYYKAYEHMEVTIDTYNNYLIEKA